jgi:hypothetical protein
VPGSDRLRQIDLHAALGEFARELTLVVIELRARPVAFVAIECEAELDRCCRPLTCLDREGVARLYRRAKPLGLLSRLNVAGSLFGLFERGADASHFYAIPLERARPVSLSAGGIESGRLDRKGSTVVQSKGAIRG